jgi:hypothetical protein
MIPIYRPSIGEREERYVAEAMESGWISSRGSFLDRFETDFAAYLGSMQESLRPMGPLPCTSHSPAQRSGPATR